MDRRRLLLMLAVFVAIIGTALVFLYVRGADNRAQSQYSSVSVLRATQNIAAGESYDAAVTAGTTTVAATSATVPTIRASVMRRRRGCVRMPTP